MIGKIAKSIKKFLQWHGVLKGVALMSVCEEHFKTSARESEVLKSCVSLGVIRESVVVSEDGGTAYVCADVRDVRTILKMYRRGQRRG